MLLTDNHCIEANLSPLGKKITYISTYDPTLLFPIPRQGKRQEIGIGTNLPFHGFDTWNAYEISWLNEKGKPHNAIATFDICCNSTNIVESKSFKLYLNSFNNTKLNSITQLKEMLLKDISKTVDGEVVICVFELDDLLNTKIETFEGRCIDFLDVECTSSTIDANLLQCEANVIVEEKLYSNLLKSNCLVTGQPDWGSIQISYSGSKIDEEGLLKYLVSFRNHNEFHEQCVERIFVDIQNKCNPLKLTVTARYTRRGGLDINPVRSSEIIKPDNNIRMARQ